MPSLGVFGTVRPEPDPDTFDYFGAQIRSNPDVSELDLIDFMEVAEGIELDDPAQSIAAMVDVKRFIRACIHPADFAEFWQLSRANRQELVDLVKIGSELVEAAVGRPTGRPSDSTGGPPSTLLRSSEGSETAAREFLARRYPARPDLQLAALRAVRGRIGSGELSPLSA